MAHRKTDLSEIHVPSSWVTNLDDATMRRAALYVATRAHDTNDARHLLTALGIIADPLSKTTGATQLPSGAKRFAS